jgi:hypothetical protein
LWGVGAVGCTCHYEVASLSAGRLLHERCRKHLAALAVSGLDKALPAPQPQPASKGSRSNNSIILLVLLHRVLVVVRDGILFFLERGIMVGQRQTAPNKKPNGVKPCFSTRIPSGRRILSLRWINY